MTKANKKLDLLLASELAVQIFVANHEKFHFSSKVNPFITDVLNYVLQQKSYALPFDFSVKETSFSSLIRAINIGLTDEFDESWQYLVLYSRELPGPSSMLILVEDDWFLINSDESGRFIDLETLLGLF